MTKIVCISDMHGHLPDIPECDLLLIAGDICPVYNHDINFQNTWLREDFYNWRRSQPVKHCVFVAGNHDFILERTKPFQPHPMKSNQTYLTYLQDSGITCEGLNIWGSPWQKPFCDWAFNMPEEEMARKWDLIPGNTDILLLHGPPYGYGDLVVTDNYHENTGSPSLLKKIKEIKPKLVVFGHIHENYGVYHLGETLMVNASLLNYNYKIVNKPWIINTSSMAWQTQ